VRRQNRPFFKDFQQFRRREHTLPAYFRPLGSRFSASAFPDIIYGIGLAGAIPAASTIQPPCGSPQAGFFVGFMSIVGMRIVILGRFWVLFFGDCGCYGFAGRVLLG
jgi:hypothetical protein